MPLGGHCGAFSSCGWVKKKYFQKSIRIQADLISFQILIIGPPLLPVTRSFRCYKHTALIQNQA